MDDGQEPEPAPDTVQRHMDELVARAIEIRRARPGVRIVALVAEADAPEAPALRETLPEASRDPTASVAVVVTRESAKDLLAKVIPGLLDWLGDDEGGPRQSLPVLHAARRGMRTTVIEYDVPGEAAAAGRYCVAVSPPTGCRLRYARLQQVYPY